jgi:hypothetical protein
MTEPPSFNILVMVGKAAVMRLSSVILKSASSGTLKSTRTNAFLPEKLIRSIVFIVCVAVKIVREPNSEINTKPDNKTPKKLAFGFAYLLAGALTLILWYQNCLGNY